jgi:Rhodopirellula transposase DDE domain
MGPFWQDCGGASAGSMQPLPAFARAAGRTIRFLACLSCYRSFISSNWRGEPLRDYETIVNLISRTTTAKGLQVTCRLDRRKYPTGRKVTDDEIKRVNLAQNKFHGEWNYTIHPLTY